MTRAPAPTVQWQAVNRQGRETCGTSTLPPDALAAHLLSLGFTSVRVREGRAA